MNENIISIKKKTTLEWIPPIKIIIVLEIIFIEIKIEKQR